MTLTCFRSHSDRPYLYAPLSGRVVRIHEEQYRFFDSDESGNKIEADLSIRLFLALAGFRNEQLPFQTSEELKESLNDLEPGLSKLILGITHQCSMRCRYCIYGGGYEKERGHEDSYMSKETAILVLQRFLPPLAEKGPGSVSFYGGEPLLQFDMIKAVTEYTQKHSPQSKLALTTNGLLLADPGIRDFLVSNRFILSVSFDGPGHQRLRLSPEGRPTYSQVRQVLELLASEHPDYYREQVNLNIVISPASSLYETAVYFNTDPLFEGVTLTPINIPHPEEAFANCPDLLLNSRAYADDLERLAREFVSEHPRRLPFHDALFREGMIMLNFRSRTRPASIPLNGCCYPGLKTVFADSDGTLYTCERTEHYPIGHIEQGGINGARVTDLLEGYRAIAARHCPDCFAVRQCSCCFSHVGRGDMSEELFLENCKAFKGNLKRNLAIFASIKEKDPHAFDQESPEMHV